MFLQAFLTVQTREEVPVTHVYAVCREHILNTGATAETVHERVRKFLLKSDADSSRWPADAEFRDAWVRTPIYRTLARKRVRFLLETLETSQLHSKTEGIITKLSIEHLLPQTWKQHWPLPGKGDQAEEAAERDRVLHSIGNLTLVTKSLNPALSNAPWAKKRKEVVKYSALSLNRGFSDVPEWNEFQIEARAKELFKTARKVWPYP